LCNWKEKLTITVDKFLRNCELDLCTHHQKMCPSYFFYSFFCMYLFWKVCTNTFLMAHFFSYFLWLNFGYIMARVSPVPDSIIFILSSIFSTTLSKNRPEVIELYVLSSFYINCDSYVTILNIVLVRSVVLFLLTILDLWKSEDVFPDVPCSYLK